MTTREVVDVSRFLEAPELDRPKEDVPVPELGNGAVVPVWGMLPSERTAWEEQFILPSGKPNKKRRKQFRQRLLLECCRNDNGTPYFQPDNLEALGKRNGNVVERLVNSAMSQSGLSDTDVESLVGNSDEASDD